MGAFEYTALDETGRQKHGVLEGDTARQVRQQLRTQGWTPLDVDEVAESARQPATLRRRRTRISTLDRALVTRQMATLLRAGLPVAQVLQAVANQSEKARLKRVMTSVRARVREGHSLGAALAQFPNVFPELYVRTVEAGEHSGHLDAVLDRLADYTERRHELRQTTLLALFYPALLVVMALIIVGALLAYVVPQVVQVFNNVDQQLPWVTQALIATSHGVRHYGPLGLALAFAAILALGYALRRPNVRTAWDRLVLRLPLAGRISRGLNAARFASTLRILTTSNVPILEALRVSGQVLSNHTMRHALETATAQVREGSSLHDALDRTGYFPPMALSLIATGESGGNLDDMLERAAEIQERETQALVTTLVSLFEPLLILLMGGIVLVIVIAILLPIFELNQLVGR